MAANDPQSVSKAVPNLQVGQLPGRIGVVPARRARWFALTQTSANELSLYALEPEPPRDPLAAASSADDAVARHLAVLGLPIDERGQRLLRALNTLDTILLQNVTPTADDPMGLTLVEEESLSDSDSFEPVVAAPPVEAPSVHAAATERLSSVTEAQVVESQRLQQPVSPNGDVAEQFVRAGGRDRHQFAAAETIVLSGPDIKRKIRHKQSIMPSYISQVLYEDIGALFEIGDREGALVSLERLLTVSPISPQIETFLAHNEARLLEYYESVLGPWSRVVKLRDGEMGMPPAYFNFDKMMRVVSLLDGKRPLSRVLSEAGLRHIETCAVLSQLARSASLDLSQK
jgi:hypothetical protein